jgi:1,4-dihydroxy-2-naphthoate polyprenyltransferase
MRPNYRMWLKAVTTIPRMDDDEWKGLDGVSRWLISGRFAVVILTIISALLAGILAFRTANVDLGIWLVLIVALVFSHVANNFLNDLVDFRKGIDRNNYYRAQYGPQPLDRGFVTQRQHLAASLANLLVALCGGVVLVLYRGGMTLPLMVAGLLFLLFYTYPLKYVALGELSVLLVWGPCMVGGGYYVLTGVWDWWVVLASLPFALGATLVILGKHIDKVEMDRGKGVRTLPVIIGERASRKITVTLALLQHCVVIALVAANYLTPVALVVLISLPSFFREMLPMYREPKPAGRPEGYPEEAWPLWFVGSAFLYTRRFGLLYVGGLILDTLIRRLLLHG